MYMCMSVHIHARSREPCGPVLFRPPHQHCCLRYPPEAEAFLVQNFPPYLGQPCGGGAKNKTGPQGSRQCACMCTHTYMYVDGLYIKTLHWMCQPCGAHGAHQARSVHKQRFCRIHLRDQKSAGFRTVSQTAVRVGRRNKTGPQGFRQRACMCTHTYIYADGLVCTDFALDVLSSCVAQGAHQARLVQKQLPYRIH